MKCSFIITTPLRSPFGGTIPKWKVFFLYTPSPFSPQTVRCSYGMCTGRCLSRVLQLVCGILPVNSGTKWLLCNVEAPLLAQSLRLKIVLVRSRSWGADGRSISLVKKRVKIFLRHFHAHFDCAGLPKSVVLMSRHSFAPDDTTSSCCFNSGDA